MADQYPLIWNEKRDKIYSEAVEMLKELGMNRNTKAGNITKIMWYGRKKIEERYKSHKEIEKERRG